MRFVYLFELFHADSGNLVDSDIFYTVSAAIDEAFRLLPPSKHLDWKISFDDEGVLEGIAWFLKGNLAATVSTYHLDRGEQKEHYSSLELAKTPEALKSAIDKLLQNRHEKP